MEETWKDIFGFDNLYQVSNLGNIKSIRKNIIIKPYISNSGYKMVDLRVDTKRYKKYIHRLVAEAFIPNPNNLPEINHKDENKLNNKVDNLEFCTRKYNHSYGTALKRTSEKIRKKVYQYDLNDNFIKLYNSELEAEKTTNVDNGSISKCCYGKMKTAGGFKWRFESE